MTILDSSDDERSAPSSENWRGWRTMKLEHAISGMLDTIRQAADPAYPEWSPYRGNVTAVAAFYVTYVVRESRKLGLIDDKRKEQVA